MFYIHHTSCISPQQTFSDTDISSFKTPEGNKLIASEPSYKDIPAGILRRMGKAVRMSVGAAMPLLQKSGRPDGFIIGTANGGMEDCIKFLNQIINYDEGMLTPGNFVQSTPNAIAAQISLLTSNKGYNITHVHRGLAFENAMLDAAMQLKEQNGQSFLIGGVDEISSYNYNIDFLDGWYKRDPLRDNDLYLSDSEGSIAGEGAAMFLVSATSQGAIAQVKGLSTLHTLNEGTVADGITDFLKRYLPSGEEIDVFLSGENGDARLAKYYDACRGRLDKHIPVARFKHMSGEYPTASSFVLWLACNCLRDQQFPQHMIKTGSVKKPLRNILIYNNFKGLQHSFMLVSS